MKLTRENYELILFDLLEGQIPESEVDELMAQIEADPFYEKEWALLQSTVLVPDMSVVYEKKDELMKKDSRIFPIGGWYTIGIAASILLVAGFYFGMERNGGPLPADQIASELPAVPQQEPQTSVDQLGEAPSNHMEETAPYERPSNSYSNNSGYTAQYASSTVVNPDPTEVTPDYAEEFAREQFHLQGDSKGLAGFTVNNGPSMNGPNSSSNIDYLAFEPVTYTFMDRMVGKAARTMVNLSNPNLEVQPDWQNRSLDITLETEGYSAMASITPFNQQGKK